MNENPSLAKTRRHKVSPRKSYDRFLGGFGALARTQSSAIVENNP